MPRKKYNAKPVLYNQSYEKFCRVEYTIKSKGKTMHMDVPIVEGKSRGMLGVLKVVAKKHFCEAKDVNLESEPLMITNITGSYNDKIIGEE